MSNEVQGLVVNDAQGLCLKADGDLKYTALDNSAGFFSTIMEKAAALGDDEQPTVRLEASTRSILVTRVANEDGERTIAVSQAKNTVGNEL